MKYKIDKTNYKTFDIIELNKLPARAYFIPYKDKESASAVSLTEKRYNSPLVKCLNGEWDFKFYPVPKTLPDELDTDGISWDKMDVPTCWQFRGIDRPFYLNIRYQFRFDPPRIPEEEKVGKVYSNIWNEDKKFMRSKHPYTDEYNFIGVYRTFFDAEDVSKRHIISFLGVAPCLDLYVNGKFVGYSEGAHNTAEFDLTSYVESGRNELLAVVHRWCNGTYLECQDMFRNNGIFRDVLLRIEDDNSVRDFVVDTNKKCGKTPVYDLKLTAYTYSDVEVKATIVGHGIEKTVISAAKNGKAEILFEDLDVKEWSSESPDLYELYIETPSECIEQDVGFKTIKIEGDKFYVNGALVKLRGVNHHDTSCTNGYYMTPEEIERDVKLAKEYNCNIIRTSHYPPDPLLIEEASRIGIYIVDEADIETHGVFAQQFKLEKDPSVGKMFLTYNTLTNDPKWETHYVDRAVRLYNRDKNAVCVIMWSLGNESGGYYNTDRMYDYLKAHSDIPVHYESAIHSKRIAYDVASEMYPPISRLVEIGEHKYRLKELCDRPYFMCEYAHAMGVGPGAIEDYWEEIYKYDNLIGGCVWEMVDHAVLHEDGSYTYGGDHGEWEHDGNFCVDGLFYPDRTPSTGAKLMKFTYRPIRVSRVGKNEFEIFNTLSFTNANEYTLVFKFSSGKTVELTEDVVPLSRKAVNVDVDESEFVNIEVIRKSDNVGVSVEQIELTAFVPKNVGEKLLLTENAVSVENDNVSVLGIPQNDEYTILYRALTDNDMGWTLMNGPSNYLGGKESVISIKRDGNKLIRESRLKFKKNTFSCVDTYELTENGVLITSKLHSLKGKGFVPRFGKCFKLDNSFDDIEYFGRNGESYSDMKNHTQVEKVNCHVIDMTEPNIKPQESGNRTDTQYVRLTNGKKTVTFTAVDKPFELGVKRYSDKELCNMKHREDEKQTGVYVTVSAFMQGVGTGSCGPATLDKYKYPVADDYELRFLVTVE